MNVIGSRPDGWWRDRAGAIARLVGQVDRWGRGRGRAGDGDARAARAARGAPRRAGRDRLGRDAADREILARLPGWLDEGGVVVVTSDRDLGTKARALGAEVVTSRPFRAELDSL